MSEKTTVPVYDQRNMHAAGGGTARALGSDVVAEFLSSTALFRDCPRAVVDRVASVAQVTEHAAGEKIATSGARADGLGFLFSGSATATRVNATTGETLASDKVRVGEHFGEVACLLGVAQSRHVVADSSCTIVLLREDVIQQLAAKVPAFSTALARRLATRVVQANMTSLRPAAGTTVPMPAVKLDEPRQQEDEHVAPFVRIASFDTPRRVIEMIPVKLIQQHRLLPLALDGDRLKVGMVEPDNQRALQDLAQLLGNVTIKPMAVGLEDFTQAIARLKLDSSTPQSSNLQERTSPGDLTYDEADQERDADRAVRVIGDEVVTMVSRILAHGFDLGASDIHIEEEESAVRVRYRVQGMLVDWDQYITPGFARGLVARLKVLAGLDITERRLPQDGRIGLRINRRNVDMRVSTLPVSRGEKVVLRVMDAATMTRPLEQIFLERKTLEVVRTALNRPHGSVLVVGPTGSGKSSTLYACLNERRKSRPDSAIAMVEDPVEYRMPGVTQVQVNHSAGLGFPQIVRALMRQDPDVIMIGEIRDDETARIGLEAAMTGHLVMSSYHASTAMAAIQRLQDFGVSSMAIAQSVSLVIVQRLIRRLCQACIEPAAPPPVLAQRMASCGLNVKEGEAARSKGCSECDQSGVSGRVPVIETLRVDDGLRTALMAGQSLAEVEALAKESRCLISSTSYASLLIRKRLISAGEALLCVAG